MENVYSHVGSEKYDRNNRSSLPPIPTFFSSMENNVSWSIVSNAADKSRGTKNDPLPLPTVVTI